MLSTTCILAVVLATGVTASPLCARGDIGAPSSDTYPPPTAVNADGSRFPAESAIGYAGPTPTGAEPFLVATAPALPYLDNAYPLVQEFAADNKKFNILKSWGNLSPMYSLAKGTFGVHSDAEIPDGCSIDQVHLVHRHGARYPTSDGGLAKFAEGLYNESTAGKLSFSGQLKFLNTWKYTLGGEILTGYGRLQLFELGLAFRQKYGHLLLNFTESNTLPVFRTTSQDRMYKSAANFAAGFFGIPYEDQYKQSIIIEGPGFNNSLASYFVCPNSNNEIGYAGDPIVHKFIDIFLAKAVKRLQPMTKGYKLRPSDAYSMMQLCSYETVSLGYSKFCQLFTEEEFRDYAYSYDLEFWYSYSFGNPTSAALGVGYVTELLAILTKQHTKNYNTSVNSTLAESDITNPLNQSIYVSATHDTVISSIIVALNFTHFTQHGPLPTHSRPDKQAFHVDEISPFAARMTGQVLSCQSGKQFRWLLNDAVVPLHGLKGCPVDNKFGLCPLKTYIRGIKQRVIEIDYDYSCNGNYTYVVPKIGGGVTNGLPPHSH